LEVKQYLGGLIEHRFALFASEKRLKVNIITTMMMMMMMMIDKEEEETPKLQTRKFSPDNKGPITPSRSTSMLILFH